MFFHIFISPRLILEKDFTEEPNLTQQNSQVEF